MNYSVIRRYTPPTCTLNLLTQKTWALRATSLSDLQFELRFDDPRLPEEQQLLVRGDRECLERLSAVVGRYVQELVLQLPQLALFDSPPGVSEESPTASPPRLHANSLLAHELVYEPGTTIPLSTLQLFDLANALEAYSQDILTLPQLESAKIRRKYVWAGVATAIVVALGIPVGIRMLVSSEAEEPVVLQDIETQPRQPDPVEVVPPLPPPPPETVLPSPTLVPPLANSEPLPPPASVSPPPSQPLPTPPNTAVVPAPSSPPTRSVTPQTTPPSTSSQSDTPPAASSSPPKLPELPPLKPQPVLESPAQSAALPDAPAGDVAPNALLDEIEQVAEVRNYFQAEWSPPENLSQILEYRLVLNRDGSIKQITPLGQASKVYLDRTGMPLMGEEFVSPLSGIENPQIRVMLDPNGTVRTFLEAP
ncbi:MAG: DUF4335 domain-containing protein [Cyanophyceae cyanobacterium]